MAIDATARVADGARLGDGVEIGPYCVVGPHVELKDGVRLIGQVNVTGVTTVGEGTVAYPFASLGTAPQSVHYRGEPTRLVIGGCEVREGVTMNIGTKAGGGITRVGERCIFMVGSHVAHDCNVGMTYADHPAALQLRAMNIIYETTKERGATILIPTSMVDSMNPVVALALAGQETAPQKANGPLSPNTRKESFAAPRSADK